MDGFTHLQTERLILRRFQDSDLDALMSYRSDPGVARYQNWSSLTEPEAREFIREQAVQPFGVPGQGIQIAIERKDCGGLIGDCFLEVDHDEPRQASVGYTLAAQQQGQGYAQEAVRALLEYAFGELNLHRVLADTDCRNRASIRLLERLHFRQEGYFLQSYWDKDRWTDEYLYALLESEMAVPRESA